MMAATEGSARASQIYINLFYALHLSSGTVTFNIQENKQHENYTSLSIHLLTCLFSYCLFVYYLQLWGVQRTQSAK
ncbi:hypothetical protein F5Y07DRAFT_378832 [Xylaria sp. FL0933]|nr:hypothetical protein F5Y07DRAFT_378832 [Xylaria sp. FL0933]